jgi:capsular polysaccharide biosynthesis protein
LLILKDLELYNLPILVWAHTKQFQQLLSLMGIRQDQIIQHDASLITHLEHALVPSLRNPCAYLDHESHALLQRLAARIKGPQSGRRLYISRIGQSKTGRSTRVMTNEETLIERLAEFNFEVIEPEQLSAEEQIAAFASADMIVGASGSAMFNVVFCRPGTKVIDIESEPDWIYAHTGLFASCQTRYGLCVGQVDPTDTRPVHRRWRVDIESLMQRIGAFLQS